MSSINRNLWSRAAILPIGVTQAQAGRTLVGFSVTDAIKSAFIWQGRVPDASTDPTDLVSDITYLNLDSSTWSGAERTHAETWINTHGFEVSKAATVTFQVPSISIMYVYCTAITATVLSYHG